MRKITAALMIPVFVFFSGIPFAQTPKGMAGKSENPKGFTQGEKSGWDGDFPNGWDKMEKKEREEWCKNNGFEIGEDGKLKRSQEKTQERHQKKSKVKKGGKKK